MAQRLTFNVDTIKDIAKTFDTMYVQDKLYDYANYITLYGTGNRIYFEMCVIMDGASNDAMVRVWEDVECEPFDKIVINFEEFKSMAKSFKSETVNFDLDGRNLTIVAGKTTHVSEASSVSIPRQITDILDSFFEKNTSKLVDFNLLKLYNNMNDIGSNLTVNTLNSQLYGIMSTPDFIVSTDGFSIGIHKGQHLAEPFMFPKHSLRILKMLPKIGAKYAILDHRMYIKGINFECYLGEWSGYKNYPIDKIGSLLNLEMKEVFDAQAAFDAIKQCHQFDEIAVVEFGKGIVRNQRGTHIEHFEASEGFDGSAMHIHRNVLIGVETVDKFYADPVKFVGRLESGTKANVFMGVRHD